MRRTGRAALWTVAAGVCLFLLAPALMVLPMSLNSSPFLVFPPPGYTLDWFRQFFDSPAWMGALKRSLWIAFAVTLLSVLFGMAAGYALTRSRRRRLMNVVEPLVMLPMIIPSLIFAVAVYIVVIRLNLLGGLWLVVIGQTILAVPFVFLNLRAGLQTIDARLESAAYTLGSGRVRTFVRITLPLMIPALIASAVLAAVLSLDETVFALFMTPDTSPTLPVLMFNNIQYELNPLVPVAAAVMILLTALVGALGGLAYWAAKRRLNSAKRADRASRKGLDVGVFEAISGENDAANRRQALR